MKHNNSRTWTRLGAAVVLAAATTTASAQFRDDTAGRARDANNRVGSDGINGPGGDRIGGGNVSGNQIVTGNVTGGRQFRDTVGYTDPREFRAITGGIESDRFVRESVPAPRRGEPTINLRQPTAYYGSTLATMPPPNFAPTAGASGSYIAVGSPRPFDNAVNFGGVGRYGIDASNRVGETIFGGPDDPTLGPTVLSASPLYGVKQYGAGDLPEDLFSTPSFTNPALDRAALTAEAIREMRAELSETRSRSPRGTDGQEGDQEGLDAPADEGAQPVDSGLLTPAAPREGGVGNQGLNAPVQPGALNSGLATGQGSRRQLLVPPQEQSQQYAELQRRLARRGDATDDRQANADFNRLRAAQQAAPKAGEDRTAPGDRPAAGADRPAPAVVPADVRRPPTAPADAPDAPDAAPDEPLKIHSLATGVKARGLADLLRSAEELMREEKYTSAIARYDAATQVAPNNPLITLGRSHAQLGAGQYGQAEIDLRSAVAEGPEVLLAQYDLDAMLGKNRLKFLRQDLRDLAQRVPEEVRPHLLLAYIAYNTGDAKQAAAHLERAEKVAGPDDEAVAAMRKHWNLPTAPSAAPARSGANK